MLPLDDLAEVASALARTDLDTFLLVDRRHHSLIQSHFGGNAKGPLRFANFARATRKQLQISCFDGELRPIDIQQFYRSLRNCYVSSLRLHRHVTDPEELAEMRDIKNDYAVNQAHLSSRDATGTMRLLEAIPQCAALKWEYALTDDFFSRASIRHVRYLTLVNCKILDSNSVQEWLHSPGGNLGDRRLTLLQDKCNFDATELAYTLKKEFLDDTQSREYQVFVYGNRVTLRDGYEMTLTSAAGDVLEVEARNHYHCELCVNRLSKGNAERTAIVVSTEGLKVWDFETIHDLESYLIRNGITELLARSGLIANEMRCVCGAPMRLRLSTPVRCDTNAPSNRSINNYEWKCSGECQRKRKLNDASRMKVVSWLGDNVLITKAIILLTMGKTDDVIRAALRMKVDDVARLRIIHAKITRLQDCDEETGARCRLKSFYENLKLEHYRQGLRYKAIFVVEE